MAVTRLNNSITMTADNDAVAGMFFVASIQFQGSGLVAGERLRITTTGGGVICDYLVEAAIDNAELLMNPDFFDGLVILDGPATGTWVVTFRLG